MAIKQKNKSKEIQHLLSIKDMDLKTIEDIFLSADKYLQNKNINKYEILKGKTVCNLFFENSTRTQTTFEIAAKRLSADVINLDIATSSQSKGESILDLINNLIAMGVSIFVVRHSKPGIPELIAKSIKNNASIINAGDGNKEHPTQALLDCYSIREQFGEVAGKNILIVGDILHSRVALSNIFALKKLGANVKVCGPKTLIPKYITSLGVEVETNIKKALEWCDVANVLRVQHERMDINYFPSTREYTQLFGINNEILDNLGKKITIMHPGPINRGVEITSDVADSDQSIILNQVENGVAVRMAVIYLLAQQIKR